MQNTKINIQDKNTRFLQWYEIPMFDSQFQPKWPLKKGRRHFYLHKFTHKQYIKLTFASFSSENERQFGIMSSKVSNIAQVFLFDFKDLIMKRMFMNESAILINEKNLAFFSLPKEFLTYRQDCNQKFIQNNVVFYLLSVRKKNRFFFNSNLKEL